MTKRSQLIELILHIASLLGAESDRDIAALAEVSIDNISNWRSGSVKELKTQTLKAIMENLSLRLRALTDQEASIASGVKMGLIPIEIEEASGPTALQRTFADRMIYDYLGHRFLYFDPQGALAWENLIKDGYAQDCWLAAVEKCITSWMDSRKDSTGSCRGPLAQALGLTRRNFRRGLDVISLGPGEGGKEALVAKQILTSATGSTSVLRWLTMALVDVSIPLLLGSAKLTKQVGQSEGQSLPYSVMPFCADFEEGDLSFLHRLPTQSPEGAGGLRLVMALGNVFGNVRDEETFLRQKLTQIVRPGDLLWLDVGQKPNNIEHDPVYPLTQSQCEQSAAFTNRRLLLEGPYRRWEAAIGRPSTDLQTRIWLREGDETCRIPGSINFCHDLVLKSERRVCTMLYSRRYELNSLTHWLEERGFSVERIVPIADSQQKQRVVHLLLKRVR